MFHQVPKMVVVIEHMNVCSIRVFLDHKLTELRIGVPKNVDNCYSTVCSSFLIMTQGIHNYNHHTHTHVHRNISEPLLYTILALVPALSGVTKPRPTRVSAIKSHPRN